MLPEVTQRPSLDSIRLMRIRQLQRKGPSSRASPEESSSRRPSDEAPSRSSSSSAARQRSTTRVFPKLELPRRPPLDPTRTQLRVEEPDGDSEDNAAPVIQRRPRGRPRKDRSAVVVPAPPASPSPSQGEGSEEETAAFILEDDDAEVSNV